MAEDGEIAALRSQVRELQGQIKELQSNVNKLLTFEKFDEFWYKMDEKLSSDRLRSLFNK